MGTTWHASFRDWLFIQDCCQPCGRDPAGETLRARPGLCPLHAVRAWALPASQTLTSAQQNQGEPRQVLTERKTLWSSKSLPSHENSADTSFVPSSQVTQTTNYKAIARRGRRLQTPWTHAAAGQSTGQKWGDSYFCLCCPLRHTGCDPARKAGHQRAAHHLSLHRKPFFIVTTVFSYNFEIGNFPPRFFLILSYLAF